MRIKIYTIYFLAAILAGRQVQAQNAFRTVAPLQNVVAGEPFRVQYIMEGNATWTNFTAPNFKDFKLVAGPDVYGGTTNNHQQVKRLTNIVFTLAALRTGQLIIPGATVLLDGKKVQSNAVFVDVISPLNAMSRDMQQKRRPGGSSYYLAPGENANDKIKRNLFLRVAVDRNQTFVGQPVVATFKLYSRLESRSEIVKNPGFYGFGVHDMISITDKVSGTETINGLPFDVHVIRKVQLYPLQAGTFTIDPMELDNKVEFSNSRVDKKTEQQVVENMYGGAAADPALNANSKVYETTLRTAPVHIVVKALPATADKGFNGATGNFIIRSFTDKKTLNKNEEGFLTVSIEGSGNFTQISAPVIAWPEGVETFDPTVNEKLDKHVVPLKGMKTFRYPFLAARAGEYKIPAIGFTYFNPATGRYENASTDSIHITVLNKEAEKKANNAPVISGKPKTQWPVMWIAGIAASVLVLLAVIFLLLRKKKVKKEMVTVKQPNAPTRPTVDDFLLPVKNKMEAADQSFFNQLYDAVWQYFSNRLHLYGSDLNRKNLLDHLAEKELNPVLINDINQWLQQCEGAIYTTMLPTESREYFFANAETLLRKAEVTLGK